MTPRTPKGRFIAEVKTTSPFGFRSRYSHDQLLKMAVTRGDGISIHTDANWNGYLGDIEHARAYSSTTFILAKGIHRTDDEIRECLRAGADAVLVVGRIPADDLLPHCWLEAMSVKQLKAFPSGVTTVWNQRCLTTGLPKVETFVQARDWWDGTLVQASMIRSSQDVMAGANLFIVGEHLPEFVAQLT